MRRRNRKAKKGLFLILLFLLFFSISASLFSYYWFTKTLFISPLPNRSLDNLNPLTTEELKTLLKKGNIAFSEVKSSTGSSILVTLKDGNDVLFSAKKSLGEQVSSLQLILSRLTIEGKRFKNLDLRFEKPTVAYE